jgi:hypothetical protein
MRARAVLLSVWSLMFPAAHAFDESGDGERGAPPSKEEGIAYKFTPTAYFTTNEHWAYDLNLRGNYGPHTAWVGYYDQPGEFHQARVGYEYTFTLPFGRAIVGAQYASGGFLGGAIGAEIGSTVYGLVGWSRTNLKTYFNLNFDPNDSVLFGLGARLPYDTTVNLFQIRDDRLSTGQQVTHLIVRTRPYEKTRWGVDLFYKSGRPEAGSPEWISATGVGIGYDFEPWFARVTWDPNVNFTPNNMLRIAFGRRF